MIHAPPPMPFAGSVDSSGSEAYAAIRTDVLAILKAGMAPKP